MDAAERRLLDAVPVALQIWEAVGDDARSLTLRSANAAASREVGFDMAAAVGRTASELFGGEGPWTGLVIEAALAQEERTVEVPYADERMGATWWRITITPLGGRRVLCTSTNVTGLKLHERDQRATERLNHEILSGLHEGVVVIDADARVVVANEAAARLFGLSLEELTDQPLSDVPVDLLDDGGHLLADEQLPLMRALSGEEVKAELVRFVRRDGSLLWVEVHANPLQREEGVLYGAVASYDDVSARVEQDRRTRHEADTDALTGLANRRALERTLEAALTRAATRSRSVGLLMLDLNGFKAVNDTHGHAAGDDVLREVALRLRACVRERDLVSRLGGDEFVVVLTDLDGRAGAVADSVRRIREALAEPITVGGVQLRLAAAIGIATFPADGDDATVLLAQADRGMYAAKGARDGSLR